MQGMSRLTDAELAERARALEELQRACQLCPRRCGVDREARFGVCGQGRTLHVALVAPHRGEEPPLCVGAGAGTIFVAGCTMRCRFCQNHQISQRVPRADWTCTPTELAARLLELQRLGCANIEWVSPTQHLPGLVEALRLARRDGLALPCVYNGNGYDRVSVLRLLDGIVDVYLPDAKYARPATAADCSQTPDYVEVNRRALQEMWRQVGPLQLDEQGRARRGLLVRHLVLPEHLEETEEVLRWIGAELGPRVWVSLMAQYYPAHQLVGAEGPLGRALTDREYARAVDALAVAGLDNGWVQDLSSGPRLLPDFDRVDPFAERECG
jgi:putative pyruvate formate lyase activating enzyme